MELVDHEAVHRVGDTHAVDEHDGVDGQPVHQARHQAAVAAGERGDHLQHVQALDRGGGHDAGVGAVGEKHHRTDEQGDQQQWDEAEAAGVDGKEQDTGADGGAKQGDSPGQGAAIGDDARPVFLYLPLVGDGEVFQIELFARSGQRYSLTHEWYTPHE